MVKFKGKGLLLGLFHQGGEKKAELGVGNSCRNNTSAPAQGLAVFPGISRSGTTICAGLLSGAERKESAKFSFLMSIPIILLSLVMEIYEISVGGVSVSVNTVGLLLGAIVAFTIGILSIKLMLRLTEKANFKWFIIYLIIIGILTIFI